MKIGDRVKRAREDKRGPFGEGTVVEYFAREHMYEPRPRVRVKWDGVRTPRGYYADGLQVLDTE